ncbi:MAG: lipocalin-like domain-containing protein [Alphaproteobacteria bacterium]|nr:lipocalin-like domain-containing protein [Alphaproteobacteria bacterium]
MAGSTRREARVALDLDRLSPMNDASLVGAWRIQSFVFTDAGGGLHYPLGKNPRGALLITPDNHLTLSFMADNRQHFAENDLLGGSEAERASAAASYVSFGGPCRIEGDEVIVEVEHSFHPNWTGGVQRRRFLLEGDRLTIMTTKAITVDDRSLVGRAVLMRDGA